MKQPWEQDPDLWRYEELLTRLSRGAAAANERFAEINQVMREARGAFASLGRALEAVPELPRWRPRRDPRR